MQCPPVPQLDGLAGTAIKFPISRWRGLNREMYFLTISEAANLREGENR